MARLLFGDVLDHQTFRLRVNQIIPRPNTSQTSYTIPCLLQPFNGHNPNRSSVSKLFENIKFRRHLKVQSYGIDGSFKDRLCSSTASRHNEYRIEMSHLESPPTIRNL
jgi:hypothetical protein